MNSPITHFLFYMFTLLWLGQSSEYFGVVTDMIPASLSLYVRDVAPHILIHVQTTIVSVLAIRMFIDVAYGKRWVKKWFIARALLFSAAILTRQVISAPIFYFVVLNLATIKFWFYAWAIVERFCPQLRSFQFLTIFAHTLAGFSTSYTFTYTIPFFMPVPITIMIAAFEILDYF